MRKLIVLGVVGLIAQLIDGSLGMAYGVTSTTLLLAIGEDPEREGLQRTPERMRPRVLSAGAAAGGVRRSAVSSAMDEMLTLLSVSRKLAGQGLIDAVTVNLRSRVGQALIDLVTVNLGSRCAIRVGPTSRCSTGR